MVVRDTSFGSRLFDVFNYTFLFIFSFLTIFPFLHITAGSLSPAEELLKRSLILFPKHITLDSYMYIFSSNTLVRALGVSIYITVVGTIINLVFTVLTAYPLAHTEIMGRKYIMMGIIFTMLFSGGMIPSYLVVKSLGMINSYWSVMLPGAISAFNLIIVKNFFQQIPASLEESAKLDGCNDLRILLQIVLPLSKPVLATFALFYAVGHWNAFMGPLLYLNDTKMWPIQILLRQIVIMASGGIGDSRNTDEPILVPPESIRMATIMVSTVPILCVYPFLQKHFTKGVMLGSVKG